MYVRLCLFMYVHVCVCIYVMMQFVSQFILVASVIVMGRGTLYYMLTVYRPCLLFCNVIIVYVS